MPGLNLQTRLSQTQNFSPRLQLAVRLLQMTSLDYARELYEAAASNPFLEIEEVSPSPESSVPAAADQDEPGWAQAALLERTGRTHEPGGERLSHDDSLDTLQGIPVRETLRAHLHAQIGVLRISPAERALAMAIVESLDEDGYLRVSLQEIGAALALPDEDDLVALRCALKRVQSLDPPGIGARSVGECLALQLPAIEDAQLRTLAACIVERHLDVLATHNPSRLAALLRAPLARVQAACEQIRRLNARPGWQFDGAAPRVVIPDVTVRKVGGRWRVVLNDSLLPRVRLHASYIDMFEQSRERAASELGQCLQRARWTIHHIAQRSSTIHEVAKAIVARQKLFLEHGALAMKPLALRDVADAVGVHPSTISRAVHGKYMATPHGVFELRHFFSRGLQHTSGRASAPSAVRALIGELIESESPDAPLSDAELARQLAGQGFHIARRTVTKYRQALRLAPAEQRRGA